MCDQNIRNKNAYAMNTEYIILQVLSIIIWLIPLIIDVVEKMWYQKANTLLSLQDFSNPYVWQKMEKTNFFRIKPLIVGEWLTKKWLKIIYSLRYTTSQVYILKTELKWKCLIGLAVLVGLAYANVAIANCKLQKIQCELSYHACHIFSYNT